MYPDIAIIGGGAIGLSCAWRLAQGGARVVLYERNQVGKEASWAAAGMLAPECELAVHGSHLTADQSAAYGALMRTSRDMYAEYARELLAASGLDIELSLEGAEEDWRRPGIMYVPTESAAAAGKQTDKNLACAGQTVQWQGASAIWLGSEGQVDSRKMVEALRTAALRAGVVIKEGGAIQGLLTSANRATGVVDKTETLQAGGVLLCAGAWSGKILGSTGAPLVPVRPLAGQIVTVRGEKKVPHVVYSTDCYLVPRRDGRLLIGATVEEVGFHKRVTVGGVSGLLTRACKLVPALESAPLESHWAGLRPATPDGLPIIGPGNYDNFWLATGHGRNGILLTPATAQVLADGILRQGPWDAAFGVQRFAATPGAN